MQPYFFPYIGYFQLINSVEKFVIYDNIKFTKKGWIQRNRILADGKDKYISLQLKNDSDYLNVNERYLSESFIEEKKKVLRRIHASYHKAPFFKNVYSIIEECISYSEINLFTYVQYSLIQICNYLNINTEILISSEIDIDHNKKSQKKVIAICKALKATTYINAIGGQNIYNKEDFKAHKIELKFLKSQLVTYNQYDNEFIPWLSIIDVMMFNSKEEIREMLNQYELI